MSYGRKSLVKGTVTNPGSLTTAIAIADIASSVFQSFSTLADGTTFHYVIVGSGLSGTQVEAGLGTKNGGASPTITRTAAGVLAPTNGALTAFSAGTYDVYMMQPGEREVLPSGTSDPTPASPGEVYWNTTSNTVRRYDGTTWANISDRLSTAALADVTATVNSAVSLTYGVRTVLKATTLNSGANWIATLPAPALLGGNNQYLEITIDPASTKPYTLSAHSSENIGPGTATTRVLWAGETALLRTDGTNWFKVSGLTIPMICVMRLTAAVGSVVASGTQYKVLIDGIEKDNTGLMADTTNHRINIQRGGMYDVVGLVLWNLPSVDLPTGASKIFQNGATLLQTGVKMASGSFPAVPVIGLGVPTTVADTFELYGVQTSGSNQSVYGSPVGGGDSACYISMVEDAQW